MGEAPDVLKAIRNRLAAGPFRVQEDVALHNGSSLDLVASRGYFSWKGLVFLSEHIVVRTVARPSPADFNELFQAGLAYAKKRRVVPWPRGLQFGFIIIPVILAEELSSDVLRFVSSPPKKRWSLFEFPVACETRTGAAHYFQGRSMWGAFYFKDMRDVAERYLDSGQRGG